MRGGRLENLVSQVKFDKNMVATANGSMLPPAFMILRVLA